MNVGETRTLDFNAPSYIVGTQWSISDVNAVEFVTSPASTSTTAMIKALQPRTASNRCVVHCKYYYRELDPTTGSYIYERTGYQDWDIIINENGTGGSNNGTTVTFGIWHYSIFVGESLNLMAHVEADYNGSFRWETNCPEVCTISNRGPIGTVEGIKQGIAKIKVVLDNGNYDECEIVVKNKEIGGETNNSFLYTLNSDGLTYNISWDKNVSCSGTIKIPSYYNNKPITGISNKGFSNLDMESIIIPNSITSIGPDAFFCCKKLASINLPNSLESIGGYAFAYCNSLIKIEIPSTVSAIGNGVFANCHNLMSIDVINSNQKYASIDGALYNYNLSELLVYPGGKRDCYIFPTTTSINRIAFVGCSNLTNIKIPNSVVSIGAGAFDGCSNLTTVYLPDNLESIGDLLFNQCYKLSSVYYNK